MAIMIPYELQYSDYLSEGEKDVFDKLKAELSDDWTVIYSLHRITADELHINKSNGECDFILLHPDYRVLILEVKGSIISCANQQ